MKTIGYICDGCRREMLLLDNHEISFFDTVTLNLCTECHMAVVDAVKNKLEELKREAEK